MINKNLRKIGVILIIAFCVGLVIWGFYEHEKLSAYHNLSNGCYIRQCKYGGYANVNKLLIDYSFFLNGTQINGSASLNTSELSVSDCQIYFVGHSFPVIYQPNNPSNNYLLIVHKDFEKYNFLFPDSLKWTEKYIKE
jgi:hypothetical protein